MTRYLTWPRWAARAALLALVVLVALASAISTPRPSPENGGAASITDVKLYRAITADVAAGRPYYSAAAAQQRANGYPTAPAQVIREPTLALLLAKLQNDSVRSVALISLSIAAVFCLQATLAQQGIGVRRRLATIAFLMTGISVVGTQDAAYVHEAWAAMFMVLSVIIYRPDRWLGSVVLGFVACAFRELAVPFLLAMAACAAWERRKNEFIGWVTCILLFLGLYAVHCHFAGLQHRNGDLSSQGWLYAGGLEFVISTARWNLLLHEAPSSIVVLSASVALLGLVGSRDLRTTRSALIAGGYISAFAVVGRPDNYLWGILYSPFLPIGFVLAPPALRDLVTRAFSSSPIRDGIQ